MMIRAIRTACAVPALIAVAALASVPAAATTQPEWIAESNKQATALLEFMAKYGPEQAATIGVDGHDADVFDAKPHNVQRQEADLDTVAAGYERALAGESDPRAKQNIEILLKSTHDQRVT